MRYGDLVLPSEQEMKQAEIDAMRCMRRREGEGEREGGVLQLTNDPLDRAARIIIPEGHLINDFASMVNNSKYSDVLLNVGGKP